MSGDSAYDGYMVNFIQMREEVSQMQGYGQNLRTQIEDLRSQMAGTLSPDHWTMTARDEWNSAQTLWNQKMGEMDQKIGKATTTLDRIIENYDSHEKKAALGWQQSGL